MKNNYFLSQPHQPFFVLGFINAILSMLVFALIFRGVLLTDIVAKDYHAYSLIYLMFTPAFLAFIFTTYPRFSATPPIEKPAYLTAIAFFTAGSIFVLLGVFLSPLFMKIGMVITFIGHIFSISILQKIHNATTVNDKHDISWIIIALWFGVVSHILYTIGYILDEYLLIKFAIQVAIYLYLFLVAFSVAQRMIPFFSRCEVTRDKNLLKITLFLLISHVVLESISPNFSFIADFALAFLIAKHLISWKLPFPNPNPLIWILHIALFWIPTAFLCSGIASVMAIFYNAYFLFLGIHTLILGFVLTVLIGFGTRVTLGHSGNAMLIDRWTIALFYWTQILVLSRLITSIATAFGWDFILWFDIAVVVWLVLFIIWASKFFAVLIFGKKLN